MFASIRSRLLVTYFLLIAVTLGIVALALVVYLARNPGPARESEVRLIAAANALERQRIDVSQRDLQALQTAVEQADELLDVRVVVYDPSGQLLADSRSATEQAPPEQALQPQGQVPRRAAEFRDGEGQNWLYTTRSLPGGYLLLVAEPRNPTPLISLLSDEFFTPLFRAGMLALFLSLLLAYLMTRWITAPLQRISQAAAALGGGELQAVIPEGPAELQSLARTFNKMGHEVQSTQQSQRDFVANISHELRTPLTSIQGFAQAILDGTVSGGDKLRQAAQVIFDEAGRMHRLVAELIELARLDADGVKLEMTTIEIGALLKAVAEKLAPLAQQAKLKLTMEENPALKIDGDYDRLVQVFTNLVDNAIQHTPAGGEIRLGAAAVREQAEISVADSGPGIPPAEAKRIFERFYQVDKSRKASQRRGAGLGLSIAQQIVKAHSGTIELRSQAAGGSRFVVSLPMKGK